MLQKTFAGLALAAAATVSMPAQADLVPVFEYTFPASFDGTSATVVDQSGAGNNATMDVLGGLENDRPAGFDSSLMSLTGATGGHGATDAIDLLNNADVAAAGGFTMDVWVRWDGDFSDIRKIIDYAGTEHLRTENSQIIFGMSNGLNTLSYDIVAGQWYHVVAVFDSQGNTVDGNGDVAGEMQLWIDDVMVDSVATMKTSFGDSLDRPISINRWAGGGGEWNQGAIFNPTVSLGVVPEPGSLALLGLGGLAMLRRRRA